MLFLFVWAVFGRKPKGKDDVHGTASWAEEKDIKELVAGRQGRSM